MNCIKFAGFFSRQFGHLQSQNAETVLDDFVNNGARISIRKSVRLYDGESSVTHTAQVFGTQRYDFVTKLLFLRAGPVLLNV